jgi:hypothetical protein
LKLRLTSTWRALLERSDHVALIAEATFTPVVPRTRFTLCYGAEPPAPVRILAYVAEVLLDSLLGDELRTPERDEPLQTLANAPCSHRSNRGDGG